MPAHRKTHYSALAAPKKIQLRLAENSKSSLQPVLEHVAARARRAARLPANARAAEGFHIHNLSIFVNFNSEICDSTLKLRVEMIEINLPVNLNLTSEASSSSNCFAGPSYARARAAAARRPPRARSSDCQS